MRMEVEDLARQLDVSTATIVATLLDEFSSVTDYHTLRDTLPSRLAGLLQCRCVLLYQHMDETLQFAAGSFADQPGWSAALLAVAHINPIALHADIPEAQAWRAQQAVVTMPGPRADAQISTPLLYRQQAIGVLTALRALPSDAGEDAGETAAYGWLPAEIALVEVVARIVALLLENTRLLERDRERIHELSLLNGITGQMNYALRERPRVYRVVTQRAREIARSDLCTLLLPGGTPPAWLSSQAHEQLWQRWQSEPSAAPLLLERGSTLQAITFMQYLDERIKTFFAMPLVGKSDNPHVHAPAASNEETSTETLGILVGAYHRPWKPRREEMTLLQVLTSQAGTVLENIALMENVSEARNEARRLLRQVLDDQRFKESILDTIPSGLLTLDVQGRVTTFNRAAAAVLGYHPREVLGQPIHKILALRGLTRCRQSGQPQHETLLTGGRQGQELTLEVTLVPLRNEHGEQEGILATFTDITGIQHLEAETRRLDRLASLGEMSANMAHEVRNPLAAIKTSVQMLRDDLAGGNTLPSMGDAQEEIAVILKEIERLDNIVRDLLLFARPHRLHALEHDPGALCARALQMLRAQCERQGIRVHLSHMPDLPTVHIDVARMEQVLLNLFLNALQAMPDGGILSVACHVLPSGTQNAYPATQRSDEADERAWLEITINDTGVGIAQDALERIFEPFYTTKAHGIGLGLSITRRLVEDHGGLLLVESQLGYGTTVLLRLPLRTNSRETPQKDSGEEALIL